MVEGFIASFCGGMNTLLNHCSLLNRTIVLAINENVLIGEDGDRIVFDIRGNLFCHYNFEYI